MDGEEGVVAFQWTRATGLIELEGLPGSSESWAAAAAAEGLVIVGSSHDPLIGRDAAFAWTAESGSFPLGTLPDPIIHASNAFGVSPDGGTIVGRAGSQHGLLEAFRWTAERGMEGLGDLPGGGFGSSANALTPDGSVIVGSGSSARSTLEAFRWTEEGGMVGLGGVPGADILSTAFAVSADGDVVVGSNDNRAIRWTASSGMVTLGPLLGQPLGTASSQALDVSADGSHIVGTARTTPGGRQHAFLWTEEGGMRDLEAFVSQELGIDGTGWGFGAATGISDDGEVVVGRGGKQIILDDFTIKTVSHGFVLYLPEPALASVIGVGLAALAARVRKRAWACHRSQR